VGLDRFSNGKVLAGCLLIYIIFLILKEKYACMEFYFYATTVNIPIGAYAP
jgi:hypothetical protein